MFDVEFLVDNSNLGFIVSEIEGNFVLFMYQPEARESFGGSFLYLLHFRSLTICVCNSKLFVGQRLIRKADYHLGQKVNCMFRIACCSLPDQTDDATLNISDKKHCTMFGKCTYLTVQWIQIYSILIKFFIYLFI